MKRPKAKAKKVEKIKLPGELTKQLSDITAQLDNMNGRIAQLRGTANAIVRAFLMGKGIVAKSMKLSDDAKTLEVTE